MVTRRGVAPWQRFLIVAAILGHALPRQVHGDGDGDGSGGGGGSDRPAQPRHCAPEIERFLEHRGNTNLIHHRSGSEQGGVVDKSVDSLRRQVTGKDCAIVGNSGALLRDPLYGERIDQHDVVLRMNQAPTEGYTQAVGSKTTFRLLNRKWTAKYGYSKHSTKWEERYNATKGEWGQILAREQGMTIISTRAQEDKFQQLLRVLKEEHAEKNVSAVQLHTGVLSLATQFVKDFRTCMRREREVKYSGGHEPSSGFVGITFFTGLCERITTYGIGMPTTSEDPYQYYKWRGTEQAVGNPTHSFAAEQSLLETLADNGIITWCTSTGCRSAAGDAAVAGLAMLRESERLKLEAV